MFRKECINFVADAELCLQLLNLNGNSQFVTFIKCAHIEHLHDLLPRRHGFDEEDSTWNHETNEKRKKTVLL